MSKVLNYLLIGVGVIVAIVVLNGLFTVNERNQALVLQFGTHVRTVQEPGLNWKIPILQQVEYFEDRVLDFDAPSVELILGDQKRLVVDAFARYRIMDPLQFRRASGSEAAFRDRLEPIVFSSLRSVLGEISLFAVLSEDRTLLMNRIRDEANQALNRFGVALVDVRIKRADLPVENSQAIFRRMQTERQREASELRAQGAEISERIKARADRERRVLIAEAKQEADIIRGRGDAEAIRTFAEAFGQDPEFFSFYRSMEAYRQALADQSTSMVMSPNSAFFQYFNAKPDIATTPLAQPSAPETSDASDVLETGETVADTSIDSVPEEVEPSSTE
jgi:membrane protease subunit HflC